jgi:NAD(P)-dependent dehydrogenase (short-subunit alcohol dehydrogenase family)
MAEPALYPSLKGKTAFVTGGATGIGASIVENFAAQGVRVAFFDLDEAPAQKLAADVAAKGHQQASFFHCDLRDIAAFRKVIEEARRAVGDPHVLVNNAARDDRHSIESVTLEYWDERMATNLRHQFFAIQALIEGMKRQGGGSIINIGSTSWRLGTGGMSVYVTAKAAVEGLTRAVARDLGPFKIRVNCVLPGWVMTERQKKLWLTPEAEADLLKRQCLKGKLVPADITAMVLWLAADDSRMATSQSFIIDAGMV